MIVGSKISIGYDELSQREWKRLFQALTFVNGNQEVVECYRQLYTKGRVLIPRGAWHLVDQLDYVDKRVKPRAKFQSNFQIELDAVHLDKRFAGQSDAVGAMLTYEQGQIIRPPGTGKSQIVLAFVSMCGTPALVIVHTEDILNQWVEYAQEAMPDIEIGVIRGQEYRVGQLTISTIQTLRKYTDRNFWMQFGALIADEAHHGAAASWEQTINRSPAFYRFGFTASETRADGMHPALKHIFGPVIHKQEFSSPVKLSVEPVRTRFYFGYRGAFDWMPMLNKLVQDDKRNRQIARIVNDEISRGNSILVLSRRIEHLERIASLVEGSCEILTGKRKRVDRKRILRDFRSGKLRCLLATQLADEALDVPRLNRVVLTHPGKHEGRIIQQIGRAIRTHPEKHDAVIYDIVDMRVNVLRRQWSQRRRTYKANKISIRGLGKLL
jgi:superfamily II DNA or RNA helicase